MIDEDRTMQLFGYESTDLSPQSHKNIVRVCDECGGYALIRKDAYHDICGQCMRDINNHSNHHRENAIKQWSNPNNRRIRSERFLKMHTERPDISERISAGHQGQNYDAGEWTGYTDKSRSNLLSMCQCTQLNGFFEGFDRHHITNSVLICMPKFLHQSIRHQMPNDGHAGKNMGIINGLAIRYLLGEWLQ